MVPAARGDAGAACGEGAMGMGGCCLPGRAARVSRGGLDGLVGPDVVVGDVHSV
ncbi:hypothetical protein [Streptomyces sp. NPDC093111]|uniref:hypothetical protein n=1 Tax=Streptomyces sp. NPDC093111 TaxID=3154978 RepID=UPI00341519CB